MAASTPKKAATTVEKTVGTITRVNLRGKVLTMNVKVPNRKRPLRDVVPGTEELDWTPRIGLTVGVEIYHVVARHYRELGGNLLFAIPLNHNN